MADPFTFSGGQLSSECVTNARRCYKETVTVNPQPDGTVGDGSWADDPGRESPNPPTQLRFELPNGVAAKGEIDPK